MDNTHYLHLRLFPLSSDSVWFLGPKELEPIALIPIFFGKHAKIK